MIIKIGKVRVDAWTLLIIIAVIGIAAYFSYFRGDGAEGPDEETVKCIASNSIIYVSTGCSACAEQEALFGDNFWQLNIVDCMIDGNRCGRDNVTRVPTWIIGGRRYMGVQQIDTLKELTGCSGLKEV